MNAWGRGSARSQRRGGCLGSILLLVVGIAAGAAGYHYLGGPIVASLIGDIVDQPPASVGELQDRTEDAGTGDAASEGQAERQNREIARLSAERDRLRDELDRARTGVETAADLDAELARLREERIPELERTISEKEIDLNQARARLKLAEDVNNEMQASLDEAEDANDELRARLDFAEQVNTELQDQVSELEASQAGPENGAQSEEVAKLRETLAERGRELQQRDELLRQYDAEFVRLQKLEEELSDAREKISTLEGELEAASRDEVAEDQPDPSAEKLANLESRLAETREALETARQQSNRSETELNSVRAELADAMSRIEILREERAEPQALERAQARIEALQGELEASDRARELADQRAREQIEDLEAGSAAVVEQLKAELAKARGRIGDLQARLSEAEQSASDPADTAEPEPAPAEAQTSEDADSEERPQRDPLLVAGAMQRAAGIQDIDTEQRDRIATRLIEGECVSEVLRDEFGRAPAVALRDLISALDSDC